MAMIWKTSDVWGIDPFMRKRYAEFIAKTQGEDPDWAEFVWIFIQYHPSFNMIRCLYHADDHGNLVKIDDDSKLPGRLNLVHAYELIPDRDSILDRITGPEFNPVNNIILEEHPDPVPVPPEKGREGSIEITESSTDHVTVLVHTDNPAILLWTESYSKDWKATALEGSD